MDEETKEIRALRRAIKIAGSQQALAKMISTTEDETTQQTISWWLNEAGKVPAEKVIPIEAALSGQVSRHDLRPDIYPVSQ